jgi:hypothetical protein
MLNEQKEVLSAYKRVLNESTGSVSIQTTRTETGNIDIDVSSKIASTLSDQGFSSVKSWAEQMIVGELDFFNGEVTLSDNKFEVFGILKNGKTLNIEQRGDFAGTQWISKYSKPSVSINTVSIVDEVEAAFEQSGAGDEIDLTRTDIWSKILK